MKTLTKEDRNELLLAAYPLQRLLAEKYSMLNEVTVDRHSVYLSEWIGGATKEEVEYDPQ